MKRGTQSVFCFSVYPGSEAKMALSPKDAKMLSPELAGVVASLQQSIDTSLCQFISSRQPIKVALPRHVYDGFVLTALMRIYQNVGWTVQFANQDGAIVFTFTDKTLQEV